MRKFLTFLAWTAGAVAVLILIGRLLVFRVWTIPDDPALSASLAPTLASGDVVLVMFMGDRGVGDLVRCPDPEDPQRWVVGRILATSGDKISVDQYATVNGRRYSTNESCKENVLMVPHPTDGHPVQHHCSRVEIAGGWHFVATAPTQSQPKAREHTVGAGRVFLVSDNRTYHDDSRDFGAVPAESCSEQIFFRLWGKDGFFDGERRFTYIR